MRTDAAFIVDAEHVSWLRHISTIYQLLVHNNCKLLMARTDTMFVPVYYYIFYVAQRLAHDLNESLSSQESCSYT